MNASVKLLEAVLPATVALRAQVPEDHPSAQILGTERVGSGVLIDRTGLILTVNYVVLGARTVEVCRIDETPVHGRVIVQDFASGLAVVEIQGAGLSALPLGVSSQLQVGQDVFIMAAASDNQRRVNNGAVASLAPFDAYWEYSLERAITTTAMNPGLGGGALLNALGQVVGIVSLDLNEVGRFTLAIPVDEFVEHRSELLQHGRRVSRPPRAWIGFYCYTFRDHVVIAGVLPGTPGEHAGLKAGDVVLAVDDRRVYGRRELYDHLWTRQPGETIALRVFRNNEVKLVNVESGDAEAFFA